MKKVCCFILSVSSMFIQDDRQTYKQHSVYDGTFTCVSSDESGMIVAADANGVLYSFNKQGNLRNNQSYSQYGLVSMIDASNALDVFVYFRTSRKLLVLDNQLNYKKELDFNMYQNYQVQGLGRAADGMCWVLDGRERVIRKVDFNGRTLQTQMMRPNEFPKQFCRILDNGSFVVVASDADTMVRVYSSSLLPLSHVSKPATYWTLFNHRIYSAMDSNMLLATQILNGLKDTIKTIGSMPLNQISIYSGGMVSANRKHIAFYEQQP